MRLCPASWAQNMTVNAAMNRRQEPVRSPLAERRFLRAIQQARKRRTRKVACCTLQARVTANGRRSNMMVPV